MTHGIWSFLHEWAVYEYLNARFEEGVLRIKSVVKAGNPVLREKWSRVTQLQPIIGTGFPDIKSIKLAGDAETRCAEVKFTTSQFNYHKSAIQDFENFVSNNGFILVLAHDQMPEGLEQNRIDIFELDRTDFETWCRVNFPRLFNRQVGIHAEPKIWIMYQGPNFNEGSSNVRPARASRIWCPTENLTGFDLTRWDRVLFVKTSGASRETVQPLYLKHPKEVAEKWSLEEIYVAEVSSKIFDRREYCLRRKIPIEKALWKRDPNRGTGWRWNRVFEFRQVSLIKRKLSMKKLFEDELTRPFVEAVLQTFCFGKSRELDLTAYNHTLEFLAGANVNS